jgi:glycosyltransferase involved in cell wall biosynthesis
LPQISFCIPFYSGLNYLKKAIESVQRQTLDDWELIVVDDCGPNDEARDWVTSLSDSRVQYFRNDVNLGLAGNWNRCLELANSELVTLLHADDQLESLYAQRMVEAAQRFPDVTAFFCRAKIIDHDSKPAFSFPDFIKGFIMPSRNQPIRLQGEAALAQLLKGVFIFCPTLCFRRSRLSERRFSSEWKMVLDLELIARLLMDGDILYGLPEKLYSYRRHSSNQTSILTSSFTRFEEEVAIYKLIGHKCQKRSWMHAQNVAYGMRIIKLNLAYCLLKSLLKAQFRQAFLTLKFINRRLLLSST